LDWTPRAVEEEVNQDMAVTEQRRKQPYNMGKYRQKSNCWQAIVYAGDALWNDRMIMMMMQTFNNLYTGQSTTNCLPDIIIV
jgi:monomeric isocitrate dehydrogenase